MKLATTLLAAASVLSVAAFAEPAEGETVVTVNPATVVSEAAPDLWGIFFEDIDLSLDGGIFAEKVRNGSFEHWEMGRWNKGLPFEYWQTLGACEAQIVKYDKAAGGNTRYAHVRARAGSGLANEGFFGIAVEAGKEYRLRYRIRGNKAPVAVMLERYGAEPVAQVEAAACRLEQGEAASSRLEQVDDWQEVDVVLVPTATDARCRLAFRATADDEFDLDTVSLMPSDAVAGMFRRDLVEKLVALKPSFVRFPGGCWVEGDTMKEAYRWKKTLAPRWERPPQWNIWKYWSSNAVGFHEYLLLCEALGAKPLFCINCGMSHKETVPMEKMGEFVQDALDCIEYANGGVESKWGAVRAANGHPEPFGLEYLEIGNENGGKEYEERYALIANAVREKYPDVKFVFNNWKSTKRMDGAPKDLRDDHFYDSPERFAGPLVHQYDEAKGDFGIFVGEYAVQRGVGPWGDLKAAIAEAAFMTGLERNQDKVKLAAYAPLFANVEHAVWTPNLIYVAADRSFVTPSWTVQKLFSENRGEAVLKVAVEGNVAASAVRGDDGAIIVKLVNFQDKPEPVRLNLRGAVRRTVFTGIGPDAHNSLAEPDALKERTDTIEAWDGTDTLPPLSLSIYRLPVPWEDETVSGINRLPARSVMNPLDAHRTMSLDGEWDFEWDNGAERDKTKIVVPGCWQLQGARMGKSWDPPQYVNIQYPFAYDPPRVTSEPKDKRWTSCRFRNPRGIYTKLVAIPDDWKSRRTVLRLYGYSSAVFVRVDGKLIGYGEDGRLPNEWDLTEALRGEGEHELQLEVLKFSDGSYLEDQDFWRMSGLFRSVELVNEAPDGLRDFSVRTRVEGGTGFVSVVGVGATNYTWTVSTGGSGVSPLVARGSSEVAIPDVALWSHETPNLYTVRVECAGDVYERRFGFRTVTIEEIPGTDEMKGGMALCVNGKRIVVCGVDRHEMSPAGGYTMTREEMRRDIELLKKFNINAVRTSHYPNDPYWYELCDEKGIFVVAEANVEAHGSGHPLKKTALSHFPSWEKSFVERATNEVAVLRDHPSIIVWSVGNESGNGANMIAAYKAVKAMDPTRPVQYEGVFNPYGQLRFDVDGSDIICPMYETPAKVECALEKGFARPYILCEFSHAMGNSNGNFGEYMALTKRYASFQGGFIWDFADQALTGADGYLKYGGDFGDLPNDRNGHCNGLFDACRNPHPGAFEVAYHYGNISRRDAEEAEAQSIGDLSHTKSTTATKSLCSSWTSCEKIGALVKTMKLGFWRAPTDNDRGNRMPRDCAAWRKCDAEAKWDEAKGEWTYELPEGATVEKSVRKVEGGYEIDFALTVTDAAPELPRVGVKFKIAGGTDTLIRWHGAGPHENYCDRRDSARVGDWAMTVAELDDSHYVRPQECGHRTLTTELDVGGIKFTTQGEPFEFNVMPWSTWEVEKANHAEELPQNTGELHILIDAAMRGVGGDDSWGAPVHDEYRLRGARTYRLRLRVEAAGC